MMNMLFHPNTRKAFLDHMRNISWQVIVLSLALAMIATRDVPAGSIARTTYVGLACLFILVWAYGTVASGLLFIESALSNLVTAENELVALREEPMKWWLRPVRFCQLVAAHWKHIWAECLVAIASVAIAGSISLVVGFTTGAKLVSSLHSGLTDQSPRLER